MFQTTNQIIVSFPSKNIDIKINGDVNHSDVNVYQGVPLYFRKLESVLRIIISQRRSL